MGTSAELPRAAAAGHITPRGGATEITKVTAARLRLYGFAARGFAECTAAESGWTFRLIHRPRSGPHTTGVGLAAWSQFACCRAALRAVDAGVVQWQSGCYQAASRWSKLARRQRPIDPSGRWNFGRFFRLLPRRNNSLCCAAIIP